MRKVSGIVTYTDHGTYYTLEAMTVITSNKHHISLVVREHVEPYHYEHFTDLYKSVLMIAKNNDFYFDSFNIIIIVIKKFGITFTYFLLVFFCKNE